MMEIAVNQNLSPIESKYGVQFPDELHKFLVGYHGEGIREWGTKWYFAQPRGSNEELTFDTPTGQGAAPLFSDLSRRIAWSPLPSKKIVPFIRAFQLLAEEARAKGRIEIGGYLPGLIKDSF